MQETPGTYDCELEEARYVYTVFKPLIRVWLSVKRLRTGRESAFPQVALGVIRFREAIPSDTHNARASHGKDTAYFYAGACG